MYFVYFKLEFNPQLESKPQGYDKVCSKVYSLFSFLSIANFKAFTKC